MSASASAPETSLTLEKLAGSMLACNSASRHSSELAAKANIARVVSSTMRALGEPLFIAGFIAGDRLEIAFARCDGLRGLEGWHDASYARMQARQTRTLPGAQRPLLQIRPTSRGAHCESNHLTNGRTVVKPPSTAITCPVRRATPSPSNQAITSAT